MDGVSPHPKHHAESSALVSASLERHQKKKEDPKHTEVGAPPPRLSCEDFTVESGKELIEALIQTWGVRSRWRHSLDFLYVTELEHCSIYHYRARFSAPTPREPIQQTASVFFGVNVSKLEPPAAPLEVHFVVESNRLVNTSGRHRFRENWLTDVIDSKKRLGAAVDLWTS